MALQAQQIVALATQIAKVPGYTLQAGQMLNMILADLAETYDLEVARKSATVNLNTTTGSGPYNLPSDYLRMAMDEVFYLVDGVPYVMVSIDLSEYDALVQQAGISNYPAQFATDVSGGVGNMLMYVWPPSGGSYNTTIRYYSQPSDITTPETSTSIPWFPNQTYLITRLAGELMKIAGDSRQQAFLGNGSDGAQGILHRYLELQKDDDGRAKTVHLDRRRFGSRFDRQPNTKTLGW